MGSSADSWCVAGGRKRRVEIKGARFSKPPGGLRKLFWLACKYAAQFQADEIELPPQMEPFAASLPFARLVMKREQRRYLCYPASKDMPLALALPSLTLHLTDGDSPFT